MSHKLTISFAAFDAPRAPVTVVLAGCEGEEGIGLGPYASELDEASDGAIRQAAKAAGYSAGARTSIELLAPTGVKVDRLIVMGIGANGQNGNGGCDDDKGDAVERAASLTTKDWQDLGGAIYAAIAQRKAKSACLVAESPADQNSDENTSDAPSAGEQAARLALGAMLRSYQFDKYKSQPTKKKDDKSGKAKLAKLVILCADPKAAEKAFQRLKAVGDGVFTARDLVNEPANALGPVEFADRAKTLEKLGVDIDILGDKELADEMMGALLAVGQGSERPSRVVVMEWRGAKSKKAKPICFVGKGVVFDTGGISMKPAGGMEDMKGDMGGAACVVGLMQALAGRKAKVNAVGLIGLTENMPSGTATRPGDIITSRAGKTIEVLNTDAEGRLVLADVIDYAQERFKPRMMIDLATLTGAILVALGKERAGLFSNNDELARQLSDAGEVTGETVWRMPLGRAYDKMIDSKNADIKNIGGRYAGSITAAQFLQRFIKPADKKGEEMAWAHLDIAGTAMGSPASATNRSWGSGWGVQLLDRLVADYYE